MTQAQHTTGPYTMHIEKVNNNKQNHPYHLGTDLKIAESFVFEKLRQPGTVSVALRGEKGKLVKIYDWRDLETGGEDE